jgi:16S rRNA (cytidine1402-2'-O)-methyltransferase
MLGARAASLGLEMERNSEAAAAYLPVTGDNTASPAAGTSPGKGPSAEPGTLTVAAAPIGQPADASSRLAPALREASLIAAEDTRRLRRLAAALGVELTARIVSYYDDVEARRVPTLLAELKSGQDVLLITDAGLPTVSDPGYRLISAAAQSGVRVTVLPGPSAVTAALAISGLPSDRFVFEGFPPRREGERSRRFAELAAERRTLVFFESPRRLARTLGELAAAFGADRRAAVCRELTKTHEEVLRGTLGQLANKVKDGVLGEITVVIAGASTVISATPAEAAEHVAEREQGGQPRKEAIVAVARELGLPKREVYDAVLAARRPPAAEFDDGEDLMGPYDDKSSLKASQPRGDR